eukprot:CAMPEP_0117586120 /NCGR_PEP_ID=MMETSP0784-20121206/68537_1 /TAXON_ID=39447 /ORGANISM="" /LENGTH=48 /DNA_ID= /DNA_START= /DNA_END= /DNA_ORIENTATION=
MIERPSSSAPLRLAMASLASCGVANSTIPVPLDQVSLPFGPSSRMTLE